MLYENIVKNENIIRKNDRVKIVNHFNDGAFIEILSNVDQKFNVQFFNSFGNLEYSTTISSNSWTKTSKKYFEQYTCRVYQGDTLMYQHIFDASGKRVYIILDSKSLGDTIAWIPYVEEFRKKWNCKVIVSTFLNYLFEDVYPEIDFVTPGTFVDDVYATYRIGWYFSNENGFNVEYNKDDCRKFPLQKTATDILGLDFKEIKPKIRKIYGHTNEKPHVCIATNSTAQAKYWNNPTGWQELVDYVKSIGYDVYLLSKEEDGYMGNKQPDGVIKISNKSLDEIGSILKGSKLFVGLGSGLTWYSWALNVPTVLISGFSEPHQEMKSDVVRIINTDVCHGCFAKHLFDRGDWNWCPEHKGTERHFECTKSITFDMVKPHIENLLKI
jgi:autotransporter strand-loop-strand O-heptosyltransferase